MDVDLSQYEGRIDASTPQTAKRTLTEAAQGARTKASQLDDQATTWRRKGANAEGSKHTAHLAPGFYNNAAKVSTDAEGVRATAAAWEAQASRIA